MNKTIVKIAEQYYPGQHGSQCPYWHCCCYNFSKLLFYVESSSEVQLQEVIQVPNILYEKKILEKT